MISDLNVTPCSPGNIPKEVLEFNPGKTFPILVIHKDLEGEGGDDKKTTCSNLDEIEGFLSLFPCERMKDKNESDEEAKAESKFANLVTVNYQNSDAS